MQQAQTCLRDLRNQLARECLAVGAKAARRATRGGERGKKSPAVAARCRTVERTAAGQRAHRPMYQADNTRLAALWCRSGVALGRLAVACHGNSRAILFC